MRYGDVLAMDSEQRGGRPPRSDRPSSELLARLSVAAAFWVDGGAISRWAPVYGRLAKPVAMPGQQARYVLTKMASPPVEATIRRWVEHQRLLVVAPEDSSPSLVFWRLAVRQRAFAIDAHASADVRTAFDRVRELSARAAYLQVTLGFFAGESVPSWVVRDGDLPVMVGMPHFHLVPTADPSASLAALVGNARIKPQVHEVSGEL